MSGNWRWYVPIVLLVLIIQSHGYHHPDRRYMGGQLHYCDAELRTMLALTCGIHMRIKRETAFRVLPPRFKILKGIALLKKNSRDLIQKAEEACCRKLCSTEEMTRFCPILSSKSHINYDLFFNVNYQDL